MSDESEGDDSSPDDPSWVDDILSRAIERAKDPTREPRVRPAAAERAAPAAPAAPATVIPRPSGPVDEPDVISVPLPSAVQPLPTPSPNGATCRDPIVAEVGDPEEAAVAETSEVVRQGEVAAEDVAAEDYDGTDDEGVANRRMRSLIEWAAVIIGALVVALLIKTFMFQAFYIPSESMEPTLNVDDRILVNKLSYRLHDVHRGDVVVFNKPPSEHAEGISDLIKRVIALEGETLTVRDGKVYVDDQLVNEPYLMTQDSTGDFALPPGCLDDPSASNTCTVPPGHVFVMGDNRENSKDSRVFGPIDEDLIVGRAFVRVWPITDINSL